MASGEDRSNIAPGKGLWGEDRSNIAPGAESLKPIRKFESGADRDVDDGKNDYEGALSPLVIRAFGDYMLGKTERNDGTKRSADNWQKGIDKFSYASSLWRHLMDFWLLHRGYGATDLSGNEVDIREALCAILFNAMGYLHEELKADAKLRR